LTLDCLLENYGVNERFWYFNNKLIEDSEFFKINENMSLSIFNLNESLEGSYSCDSNVQNTNYQVQILGLFVLF
jgi:hypothetical protein